MEVAKENSDEPRSFNHNQQDPYWTSRPLSHHHNTNAPIPRCSSRISFQFVQSTCSYFFLLQPTSFPLLTHPLDHSDKRSHHHSPFFYHYCSFWHLFLIYGFIAAELYHNPLLPETCSLLFSYLHSYTYSTWYLI